ncbi:hypothetical protein TWF694_004639 [Orbilia ellipsospora]|uniref:Uncharacterized protein n=1 Tax=Orbilia ellipsospora TaxID=2528407 RepID=A0AAV9WVV1_9PEZI
MHSFVKSSLFPLALVAIFPIDAKPVPQLDVGMGSQGASPQQICALPFDQPKTTWPNSGASFELDDFILRNGPSLWVNRLDQMTTDGGSSPNSNIECTDIQNSGNCPAPSIQCQFFTPPSVFFIRSAASTCHRLLSGFLTQLSDAILLQSLQISTLLSDFGPPESGFNVFGVLSGAFSIAAGLATPDPIVSASFGALSGVFGIAGSAPDSSGDFQNDIQTALATAFSQTRNQVINLAKVIFGGDTNTAILSQLTPNVANQEMTDIGKFFSGGRFLIPGTTPLSDMVTLYVNNAVLHIKQALAIRALKNQGFVILIDTGASVDTCTQTGSRFLNNKCYKLVKLNFPGTGSLVSRDIDRDLALKLDNSEYQLDVAGFYLNAEACQNSNGGNQGQAAFQPALAITSPPPCFFNMRVVTGKSCNLCAGEVVTDPIGATCNPLDFDIQDRCPGE